MPTRSAADEEALIQRVVEKILNAPDFLAGLIKTIEQKLETQIVEKFADYNKKINLLEEQLSAAKKDALQRSDDLEQYTRLNSLRIFGVPENKGESTDEVVIKLCKDKLGLDITPAEIDCSHRLPGKESNHRPIIVKFVRRCTKKLVFNKKKLLKGLKIVIKEDLTNQRAQLLKKAADKYGFKNTWSYDGKILAKVGNNIIRITSHLMI